MRHEVKFLMVAGMLWGSIVTLAQTKSVDQRMEQDIEVAENILGTLLRQETGRRTYFPVEVKGNYVPGYGVTFRLPFGGSFNRLMGVGWGADPSVVVAPGAYSYSYSYSRSDSEDDAKRIEEKDRIRTQTPKAQGKQQKSGREREEDDSTALRASKRFMDVAKSFMADYGDVISGLKADERIIITNRSEDFDGDFAVVWMGGRESRRQLMSVEGKRADVDQLKQGKISRTEFMNRLKVVNTETTESLDPDLEVLASMLGRLYREDLSKTYYVNGSLSYERLKDFGAMYYMKVYSSNEQREGRFDLPTAELSDVSQTERDKKVAEMYPKFEADLKENLVEYGRTLRSLKDEEQLVLKVRLTKCVGCGIPSTLELSVKAGALKDYGSGKTSKEATMAKVSVKKAGVQ